MPVETAEFKSAFGLIETADSSTTDAVEAISRQLKIVQGLAHTDALSDLTSTLHAANKLVAKLSGMDDITVQSHLDMLKKELPPIQRLIQSLTKKDQKLPEGHQLVRKAMVDGNLAEKATDPKWVRKVDAWLRSLPDEVDIDTRDDVVGLFKLDQIKSLELLDAALKRTTEDEVSRDDVEDMGTFQGLPKFKRGQVLDKYRETPEMKRERKKREDMAKGERFLSSEYRSINPLLAAFENLGVDPTVHSSPDYDYGKIKSKLLVEWRKVAVERGADKELTDTWDLDKLAETYEFVRAMARVWDDYEQPEIKGNTVTRGDTGRFMFTAYPILDPEKNNYPDGVVNVSATITWPGMMSTTVGDPKEHNFITAKTFIWKFTVASDHPGRIIGSINPSEQEVTFPVGVKVNIKQLIVRRVDKSFQSGEFGANAEVIAIASLG